MNCPSCRHALHEDARFCSNCGLSTASQHTGTDNISQQPTLRYSALPDPLIGLVLDAKYELLERLGEGGMGAVYRARRLHIGDEVAVKVLRRDLIVDTLTIERFRREARSAAMIRHPNVVSIHDFSDAQSSEGPAYIVMELVRGPSLRSLLESEGRLSPERAVRLMNDICAGVGVAHRQGVVHRDLKPDNIIIALPRHEGERETAKVVDFGIAKLRDMTAESGLTRTGAILGTIYYTSPEQCRGEELDARADVYSLGAMLYELLSGEPPFHANNIAGFITKHLSEMPRYFPPELRIPAALSAICFKALAKNREDRQIDALALGRELQTGSADQSAINLRGVEAQFPGPPAAIRQSGSASSSNWLKWAGAGLIMLLLLIVVGGGIAAYLFGIGISNNSNNSNTSNTSASPSVTKAQTITSPASTSTTATKQDLRGTWTGTYGPLNTPAKLIIKNQKNNGFDGTLQQGEVTVSFAGTYDANSLEFSFKELEVLKGSGWDLGDCKGKLSADGTKLIGTGTDNIGAQFGISYQCSFTR